MEVLGTLADAPTAAIAVIAIVLGLLFAARGPRGERRPGGGADEAAPVMLADVPIATRSADPGFIGPEGSIVGHGPIHLGARGPLGGGAPMPEPETAPAVAPESEPTAEPAPVAEPDPELQAQPAPSPIPFKQGPIRLRPPAGD